MRAAQLIGLRVVDRDGQRVGNVHDLRFRHDRTASSLSYRLDALACGDVGVGHRLGYGQAEMAGPWPLDRLFTAVARRSTLVMWADVLRIEDGEVHIRRQRAELRSVVERTP